MSNNSTIDFLNSLQRFGWQLGLDRITALLNEMGNPHKQFRSVHVAGTNGKGSTAALLESILRQAGYKTGLYTSPHLVDVSERMRIEGHQISGEKLSYYVRRFKNSIFSNRCTYFETLTAVAFQYFADEKVEIAVIEVGLGGRYDATNVIVPSLSIITEIDLEHTEYLGADKAKIAREKGGIIKPGIPCLSQSDSDEVNRTLAEITSQHGSRLYKLGEVCAVRVKGVAEHGSTFDLNVFGHKVNRLKLSLAGRHQLRNAMTAVTAALLLNKCGFKIDEEQIRCGLETVRWPGRLEKLQDSPILIIDVAHNPAAVQNLMDNLNTLYRFERLLLVIGLLKDKNFSEISKIIASAADYVFVVAPDEPERALDSSIFAKEIAQYSSSCKDCNTLKTGYQAALSFSNARDLICITGSHYIVGEFLELYKKA